MSRLGVVFVAKIVITAFAWAGPLLLLPADVLCAAGLPREGVPFARLLGWAYVALGVAYGFGLRALREGRRATDAVVVGIVSNGGASAYLAYLGASGAWTGRHPTIPVAAWASAGLAFTIALALYWFGLRERGTAPASG